MTTPTTPAATASAAAVPDDRSVRTGTVLMLAGIAVEYAVSELHPSHEDPDDHHAVFPEYAASDDWIAVHLGQFAAGLLVLLGILTLPAGLRSPGAPRLGGGPPRRSCGGASGRLPATPGSRSASPWPSPDWPS